MPILSRGAINEPNNARRNFGLLRSASPCDNVLLESRLALELFERGMVEFMYPIMVRSYCVKQRYSKSFSLLFS